MRTMTVAQLGEMFDGPHATPTRRETGPYFLNIASLNGGRLDLSQSDHVSDEDFGKWTRRVTPQGGDLLFSYETRLGEAALLPEGVEACLGRRMALIRPDRSVIEPRYLLYRYLAPDFQRQIDERAIHGATVDRIGLATMGGWPVEVHDLPEQRAIAEVLGALDDKIAANDRLVAIASELAKTLFRRSVSQVTAALADVALVTMGTSPTGETFNERGEGTPFQQGVRDFGVRSPVDRIWTTSPIRLAEPGDTLLSVRAPVGRTNVADKQLCIGRGLAAVRSLRQAPWILFHSLTSVPEVWEPFEAGGTVFGSINKPQLNSLQIPLVTEGRERLESELAALENQIAATSRESQTLGKVRDTLLPELMSGRMRVKDAELTVEGVL